MIKGVWLIFVALAIDGLQAMLSLALLGVFTPVSGLLQLLPVIGTAAGTALYASALAVGFAVNLTLSLTVGSALVILMASYGLFTWRVFPAFLGEAAPGFGNLPIWTGVVAYALYKKHKSDAAQLALGALTGKLSSNKTVQHIGEEQQKTRLQIPQRSVGREIAAAFLFVFLLGTAQVSAQTLPDPLQYVVYPETPGPYETVTIEAQGVGSFLGSADFVWRRDGATLLQGVGERKLTFTTGALGRTTTVSVSIDSSQGRFSRTWTFTPSKVNLVWEAETTAPPLYKGKTLYSPGSTYKVVAFPTVYSDGARVLSSALDFQWFYRDEVAPEASGRGRATFSRVGDQLQPGEQLAVEVYYGNRKVARGELFIPATDPKVVLYPYDTLRGTLYEAALPQGISLLAPELAVRAEPYFFSKDAKASGALPFVWTLNDEEATGPDAERGILTLRQSGSGEGSATLGVSVQNQTPDQFVQAAETFLQIVFGAQQNSLFSIFGL